MARDGPPNVDWPIGATWYMMRLIDYLTKLTRAFIVQVFAFRLKTVLLSMSLPSDLGSHSSTK